MSPKKEVRGCDPADLNSSDPAKGASAMLPRRPVVVSLEVERRAARDRVQAQTDHLRVCRWLHQLAPLTVHYSRRRPRWER